MKPIKNNRARILAAAEELIFSKGSAETTIAQIARKAGVADSLVYQHFKGKTDLLFSVANERMKEVIDRLNDHLEGITDPASRLRKMVWFSLRYNDRHHGYARTLLFECRSNPIFYGTPAYRLIRQYAGILRDILEQGAAEGIFRRTIDMNIVRDIILGALDFEAIRCLTREESKPCTDHLNGIMDLVVPMITAEKKPAEAGKADRILAAAEHIFAEKGFTGAQISEIAERARVADGTIYDYFKSKEGLLLAIPEKRFEEHIEKLSEAFSIRGPMRKLRRLMRQHFYFHLTNRRFLRVFLLNIQLNRAFYNSAAYENYHRYLRVMEQVIEEGKREGDFGPHVDPRIFRDMFLGAFSNMALRWLIVEKDQEKDKMAEIDLAIDLFSAAVLPRDSIGG